MDLLYWFASIREVCPFLTVFFSYITYLGHEIIPIIIVCILYWCVDKKLAYKIGFSFFGGALVTQNLKITCRIPRPWDVDKSFPVVENAIGEARGYSFPSGHTQTATAIYGTIALAIKRNWVRIVCITAFMLVAISRMFLGVHTLLDVSVALVIGLLLTFAVHKLVDRYYESKKAITVISVVMALLSVITIVYSYILDCKGVIPDASDCIKFGGAGIGFAIGFFAERRYIDFSEKCPKWWHQLIKAAVGLIVALGAKEGLKLLIGESHVADGVRYFVLVIFAVVIYPAVLNAIFKKKNKL